MKIYFNDDNHFTLEVQDSTVGSFTKLGGK